MWKCNVLYNVYLITIKYQMCVRIHVETSANLTYCEKTFRECFCYFWIKFLKEVLMPINERAKNKILRPYTLCRSIYRKTNLLSTWLWPANCLPIRLRWDGPLFCLFKCYYLMRHLQRKFSAKIINISHTEMHKYFETKKPRIRNKCNIRPHTHFLSLELN